jgi:uncharacterized membrane protein
MRVRGPGHAVFSIVLILIGLMGFVKGGFAPIWEGVPAALPGRDILAYLSAAVSLVCGAGLLWERSAAAAARVLFGYLLLWMLLVKGRYIVLAPTVEVSYQSCGETAVLVAGAWVLYARFATEWDRQRLGFAVGDRGVRLARGLYGLALIAFGFSHFVYLELTAPLVPAWLPWHTGWAYFTGAAFLAAGLGVLTGILARPAAALSTLEFGMLTLLVWVPMIVSGRITDGQWVEFVVSCAVTAGAWVVAESYRRRSARD